MRIIPVLDILDGVVVHAVAGVRQEYLPIRSVLCTSANPPDVALAFKSIGFKQLYVADLDAILGNVPNFRQYAEIKAATGLQLMVDGGVVDVENARKVLESGASEIIIGTETLKELEFVKQAIESFGQDRVVVSLDLKDGKIVSVSEAIRFTDPLALAMRFQQMGVTRIIVLDLAKVGTGQGVNVAIVKEILEKVQVEVLTGGGVRDIQDLYLLRRLGVSGVLLGTALHSGRLTVDELKPAGFL